MVAFGWQTVAQVWALALGGDGASCSGSSPRTIPIVQRAGARARSRRAHGAQLEPLKNIQVWRFSLYYFFVFGAFVALALWLPHYLIEVYGVDIKTAGMVGGGVLAPGQRVPRLWRASVRPLRRAARDVLDLRWSRVVATFMLSYPPTDYHGGGVNGTDRAST